MIRKTIRNVVLLVIATVLLAFVAIEMHEARIRARATEAIRGYEEVRAALGCGDKNAFELLLYKLEGGYMPKFWLRIAREFVPALEDVPDGDVAGWIRARSAELVFDPAGTVFRLPKSPSSRPVGGRDTDNGGIDEGKTGRTESALRPQLGLDR